MGDSEDWTQDIVQDFVDSHNNSIEFWLREINEKESDDYKVIKNSIAKGTPYYYGEQKYGEIGDENATEFLATLETLNPRCIKGEEIKLNRKDTELTPKK